jgi:hypothetical protein
MKEAHATAKKWTEESKDDPVAWVARGHARCHRRLASADGVFFHFGALFELGALPGRPV